MPTRSEKDSIVNALLEMHGQTFSAELGIDPAGNAASPLFRLLCASLLFSARISSGIAVQAAKALADHGWTTAAKLAASSWDERTRVLNESGYARYDESTSRMLGETAGLCLERYGGDLRELRRAAGSDPAVERRLLKEFKGIGEVGADIFCREVQAAWEELYPFADRKTLTAAKRLGLAENAAGLAELVSKRDFPRLVAALVRCDLAKDYDAVEAKAAEH